MEKKTNKAKLDIFKFLRKSSELQGYRLAFDRIRQNCGLQWKFNRYTLTRVFLHAEFISAMKTLQDPTFFMKTQK